MIDRPGARGLPVLDLPNPRVGKAAAPATRPPLVDGRLEEYLPEPLRGRRYYQPTDSGREREIKERLDRLRKGRSTVDS